MAERVSISTKSIPNSLIRYHISRRWRRRICSIS